MAFETQSVMFSRCSRNRRTEEERPSAEKGGSAERQRSGELMAETCGCCELPRAECRVNGLQAEGRRLERE
ncbi:MAG: hypothetical protein HQ516_05125 [Chlorobium sp.]|nr:hypothetical protein [Chlorobium phaeovibrioides]NQU46413.1 hypothetical protein [Chlorobium sp.]